MKPSNPRLVILGLLAILSGFIGLSPLLDFIRWYPPCWFMYDFIPSLVLIVIGETLVSIELLKLRPLKNGAISILLISVPIVYIIFSRLSWYFTPIGLGNLFFCLRFLIPLTVVIGYIGIREMSTIKRASKNKWCKLIVWLSLVIGTLLFYIPYEQSWVISIFSVPLFVTYTLYMIIAPYLKPKMEQK